jgi:glycosyltransferase involved in cell wall biosynthesis
MTYLAHSGIRGEVLVADNGSTDRSQQLAASAGARVVSVSHRGYGAALRKGIHVARGRYVIMGDSDDSYDFLNLDSFVEKLRDGFDLVMGNRFLGGIASGAMPVLHRYLGNPVLSYIGRLFFGAKIGDFHCGLRAFNRDRIRDLNLHTTGMEFASEMIISAALKSYRISEVPTTLNKDGRSRPSHLRTWRDGWRHLSFLLMFSPRWLFIYPGFFLTAFGVATMALLFPGPVEIADGIRLDIHTFLVGATAMIIGVQTLTFGLIAHRFAIKYGILPASKHNASFLNLLTFERGLILAALLAVVGSVGFTWSLIKWASVNFGSLEFPVVLRVLIISLTSITVGIQLGFTAFLAHIMNVPVTRDRMLSGLDYD